MGMLTNQNVAMKNLISNEINGDYLKILSFNFSMQHSAINRACMDIV